LVKYYVNPTYTPANYLFPILFQDKHEAAPNRYVGQCYSVHRSDATPMSRGRGG
jgi:hypothetical protein